MSKRIFGNELKYLKQVLRSEFRSSKGSVMMNRLEKSFKDLFDVEYAISHINGTATMHSILEAAGIGIGDEVIVPPLTMSSTTLAVMQANATPIYADVCKDSFLIDPVQIENIITPKTKAIITVSLYGMSPDMDRIMEIANKNEILVIEDNAECFLGYYKDRLVGTLGHVASYSFQSSKHITSGEGGMVITNSEKLASSVRKVSSLGYAGVGASKGKISKEDIQNPNYNRHITLGWNYRLPELCSAVALAQLENHNKLQAMRTRSAQYFIEAIKNCEWLTQQTANYNFTHTYWTFPLLIEHEEISWVDFRDKFVELGGDGIYAAWKLSYDEPFYTAKEFLGRELLINTSDKEIFCPVAEKLQPKLLQFKTNYWKSHKAKNQAKILKKTIEYFDTNLG